MGFTDTEQGVVRTYFDDYLPRAMDTAEKLRGSGGEERYVWTIAAWMLYEYLEQASAEKRTRMEHAIAAEDIAWHAMPFTWNSEMLDRSLIASSLRISAALDQRFGKKTIAGKLTDVPCHTRGLVGPLAEAGVRFLDIGDNGGCKAPQVPFAKTPGAVSGKQLLKTSNPNEATFLSLTAKYGLQEKDARQWLRGAAQDPQPYLFNWRDPEGAEIMVLYHPFGYGSTVAIPGTNIAVSIQVRGDNSGPHSLNEIKACYAWLRTIFPGAQIVPTNLSTIAAALEPLRSGLPVVTKEMGDTWIYGVGSDPGKVARYRELCRLRQEWLSKGSFKSGDCRRLGIDPQAHSVPRAQLGAQCRAISASPGSIRAEGAGRCQGNNAGVQKDGCRLGGETRRHGQGSVCAAFRFAGGSAEAPANAHPKAAGNTKGWRPLRPERRCRERTSLSRWIRQPGRSGDCRTARRAGNGLRCNTSWPASAIKPLRARILAGSTTSTTRSPWDSISASRALRNTLSRAARGSLPCRKRGQEKMRRGIRWWRNCACPRPTQSWLALLAGRND